MEESKQKKTKSKKGKSGCSCAEVDDKKSRKGCFEAFIGGEGREAERPTNVGELGGRTAEDGGVTPFGRGLYGLAKEKLKNLELSVQREEGRIETEKISHGE